MIHKSNSNPVIPFLMIETADKGKPSVRSLYENLYVALGGDLNEIQHERKLFERIEREVGRIPYVRIVDEQQLK